MVMMGGELKLLIFLIILFIFCNLFVLKIVLKLFRARSCKNSLK